MKQSNINPSLTLHRRLQLICPYPEDERGSSVLKGFTAVFSHVPMDHCQNLPDLREDGAKGGIICADP